MIALKENWRFWIWKDSEIGALADANGTKFAHETFKRVD